MANRLRQQQNTDSEPQASDANNNNDDHFGPDKRRAHLSDSKMTNQKENNNLPGDWHLVSAEELKRPAKASGDQSASSPSEYMDIEPELDVKSPLLIYLCTAAYSLLQLASVTSALTLVGLLFTRYYLITLVYVAYVLLDRQSCNRGGRRLSFVYNSRFWSYLAAYFPVKLRHSRNFRLDQNENYILNYTPHGISAFGAVTAFATNGLQFQRLFPGITARFMVHETSFVTPVMKETFASRGDCSVNAQSIDYMLSSKVREGRAGNLLTIVVGGLAEADLSNAEVLKVVVATRKGFVKKALVHGAHIIPCIAFGENSVFHKVDLKRSSLLYRLETRWYELFKFKHPIYYGRSLLSDKLRGVMPYKRPITVVMGDPIPVQRTDNPAQQDIDRLHSIYMTRLRSMYEANKDLCHTYDRQMELL